VSCPGGAGRDDGVGRDGAELRLAVAEWPHRLIEDAIEAHGIFDMLMGTNVPPRRKFIETHAKEVQNLDV